MSSRIFNTVTEQLGLSEHPVRAGLLGGTRLLCVSLINQAGRPALSRALAPVKDIRAELAEITATDLDRRVPQPEHPREVKELAETINETLERLGKAVSRQQ